MFNHNLTSYMKSQFFCVLFKHFIDKVCAKSNKKTHREGTFRNNIEQLKNYIK